jgi:cell division transport system permease protein
MLNDTLSPLVDRTRDALRPHLIPWLSTVIAVSLCFYLLAILSCLAATYRLSRPSWAAEDRATVYMHPNISRQVQEGLAEELRSRPEIRQVSLISQEEARSRTEALLGQWKGMLTGLGDTFFPPSLEVQFQSQTLGSKNLDALITKIRQSPEVEDVLYGRGQSRPMVEGTAAVEYLWWGGMGFASTVALLMLFLSSRALILSGRDALEIYRLAGATDFYSQAPFYLAGIMQGCIGALLAVGLSVFSTAKFQTVLPPLLIPVVSLKAWQQLFLAVGLLSCGTVLGSAGAWLALKKSA